MGKFHLNSGVGSLGEDLGAQYLKEKGFVILAKNYCNAGGKRLGEIDIVAQKGKEIVFIEVKSRLGTKESNLLPEANITRDKLRKLDRIAQCYLREKRCVKQPYHFDALSVLYDPIMKKAFIRHLEHIFI